jgi:biotin carboxyl carrier protein
VTSDVRYEIDVNGRLRQVTVHRADGRFVVAIDGRQWKVDAARVDDHTWSLLVDQEVRLKPDGTYVDPSVSSGETANDTPDLKVGPTYEGATPNARKRATPTNSYEVTLAPDGSSGGLIARVDDTLMAVAVNGRRRWGRKDESLRAASGGPERLLAPMPGKIVRVLVKTGELVHARQPMVVIEAMKMENELRASADGTVAEMHVRDGQSVDAGTLLAVILR